MADIKHTFHLFSKLPAELRLVIWRECLPHRVCELDVPVAEIVFSLQYNAPSPCSLYRASHLNACPPVISRVCRESRHVAFETGGYAETWEDRPDDIDWTSWNDWYSIRWWRDRARDSTHLNWTPVYNVDFQSVGDPLKFFAWHTAQIAGCCSLMEYMLIDDITYFLEQSPVGMQRDARPLRPLEARKLEALLQLPECLVVVRVIIVHADLKSAASTGLFGLLGDARVQIVNAADERRVDALFDLAQSSERKGQVTVGQNFHRSSVESVQQQLKDLLWRQYYSKDLLQSMCPAYMFRLCTAMCNQVGRKEPIRPSPVRGRGRGRGRIAGRVHG